MAEVLVCGSTAIDWIGRYPGSFAEYERIHGVPALNASLQLDGLHTSFGGCAMNICYGLTRLGVKCIPVSVVGRNFRDHYETHVRSLGICLDHLVIDESLESGATGIVISDRDGNQFTAFHGAVPAAGVRKYAGDIPGLEHCDLAILAPEEAAVMIRHARDLEDAGIPICFDPGQCLADFSRDQVLLLLKLAQYTIVNEHEFEMLLGIAGIGQEEVLAQVEQLIVTRGARGVDIYSGDSTCHVDAVRVSRVVDHTGCGDAFRAGYLYGLCQGSDRLVCGRLGNLMAAENIRNPDTQTYDIDAARLEMLYAGNYGDTARQQE